MAKLTGIVASALLLLPAAAWADHEHDGIPRREPIRVGVGMHYGWYRPIGAEEPIGGLGVSVRHPIDSRVTFEASGTYIEDVTPGDSTTDIRAYPVEASLLGYVFPRSPIQFYGIAGAGFEGADVITDTATRHYTRAGGHMGVGAQMNLGRLTFEADWRWILYATPRDTDGLNAHPFQDRDARLLRLGMTLFF